MPGTKMHVSRPSRQDQREAGSRGEQARPEEGVEIVVALEGASVSIGISMLAARVTRKSPRMNPTRRSGKSSFRNDLFQQRRTAAYSGRPRGGFGTISGDRLSQESKVLCSLTPFHCQIGVSRPYQ